MKKLLYLFVSLCFLFDLSAKEFPKYLWFDAEANFVRFSNRDTIRYYLDKTKETGFNTIVVDVRPIYGEVLYKKTRLPQLEKVGKNEVKRDWDYLQFFIDEAHKREMKVVVSTTFFTGGNPVTRQGLVYSDKKWASKTTLQWTPEGFKDIKDDPSKVSAFLNPSHPEVQDYVLSFVKEIVENYDIDGYALDYCGFTGDNWGEGGFHSPSCRKIIETVWRSHAAVAIISYQDLCGFGSDARMNVPGRAFGNWQFRTTEDMIAQIDTEYYKKINRIFKR